MSLRSCARSPWLWSTFLGAVSWSLGSSILQPGLAAALLLVGPLVAVPCLLYLLLRAWDPADRLLRSPGAPWAQFSAALLLLGSFALPPGLRAALLCLPWSGFCALVAFRGLMRLVTRERKERRAAHELAVSAGMLYLPVGGVWLIASRWGSEFLGFGEPIVLLTAAHFHFSGFVLPLLAGFAARVLPGVHARVTVLGVVSGVPLVALGIALSPGGFRLLELLATGWLFAATVLLAGLQFRVAGRSGDTPAALLLTLSGCSLVAAMMLAVTYALGTFLGEFWLDIPTMVRFHATSNVFGFALPGIASWFLVTLRPAQSKAPTAPERRNCVASAR